MSRGYRCDWCGRKPTEKEYQEHYQQEELPLNWVIVRPDEDVCGTCIAKARTAAGR